MAVSFDTLRENTQSWLSDRSVGRLLVYLPRTRIIRLIRFFAIAIRELAFLSRKLENRNVEILSDRASDCCLSYPGRR